MVENEKELDRWKYPETTTVSRCKSGGGRRVKAFCDPERVVLARLIQRIEQLSHAIYRGALRFERCPPLKSCQGGSGPESLDIGNGGPVNRRRCTEQPDPQDLVHDELQKALPSAL